IQETSAKIAINELPPLNADTSLFSKLMTNLIDNAIKFSKPGAAPDIRIGFSLINKTGNMLSGTTNQPHIVITVADKGIGFENTENILELYTNVKKKRKHKGSGRGFHF